MLRCGPAMNEPLPAAKVADYNLVIDHQGTPVKIYEGSLNHIRKRHPEISDPLQFVTQILQDPIVMTEDELPNTIIYHRSAGKPLMHVAYVEVVKGLVKSAHITDTMKGGRVLWLKPTELLK